MAITDITLLVDLYDGTGHPVTLGSATFVPNTVLTDVADEMIITQQPVTAAFSAAGFPSVDLIPTDDPNLLPTGWAWSAAFNIQGGLTSYEFALPAGPVDFTATDANPAVFTFTPVSGGLETLPDGTGVQLAGGSLPAGFVAATTYFVIAASGDTFHLSATSGGSAIASTSTGSGTVQVVQYSLSALQAPEDAAPPDYQFDPEGAAAEAQAAAEAAAEEFSSPTTALGDLVYGGASGVPTRLAGNTVATRKFLRQLGTGSGSAAPAWDTLVSADIPDNAASTSGNAGTATNLAGDTTFPDRVVPKVVTLTGTTPTVNAALGNVFEHAPLTGNTTYSAPTNPAAGQQIAIHTQQPASGGPYTVTFATGSAGDYSGGSGSIPAASTAANDVDVFAFVYDANAGAGTGRWCCLNSGGLGY